MRVCASCGESNPERARFCLACATPLASPGRRHGEERKLVSVLFCDLVGFTARSDRADPEDVRAVLRPYHARLRVELERFGGTVEKFVGDAVMAVFGAPTAYEDDAERAVRAALRILEAIDELNAAEPTLALTVRVGLTTGQVLVALGARPEQGEGIVTGDVVNTAARLQAVAPAGGVVVDETTWRLTRQLVSYEELAPVTVKGKNEPVSVWRATGARNRAGTVRQVITPFVARQDELDQGTRDPGAGHFYRGQYLPTWPGSAWPPRSRPGPGAPRRHAGRGRQGQARSADRTDGGRGGAGRPGPGGAAVRRVGAAVGTVRACPGARPGLVRRGSLPAAPRPTPGQCQAGRGQGAFAGLGARLLLAQADQWLARAAARSS